MAYSTSLFLTFLLPALALAACGTPSTLQSCYKAYLNEYELPESPFPEYTIYKMLREVYLVEKGPEGQTTECNYINNLIKCLGSLEDSCTTVDAFQETFKISNTEAIRYAQDFYMMRYTCTDGYADAIKYFYCYEQVGLYYPFKLVACDTQRTSNLANNSIPTCTSYQDYAQCITDVFVQHCGSQVYDYICNLEIAGIHATITNCAFTDCGPKTSFSSFFDHAKNILPAVNKDIATKLVKSGLSIFP